MTAIESEGLRDEQRLQGDVWRRLEAIGATMGADRQSIRTFGLGLAATGILVGVVVAENIISILHEPNTASFFEPFVREGSSWLTFVLSAWIPWRAIRHIRAASLPRWRGGLIHVAAALLFSACHVGGFVALRTLAYGIAGWPYHFPAGDIPYELRKEVIGYVLTVAVFRLAALFVRNDAAKTPPERTSFDIRDGARLVRVSFGDILAITSAGNYAEFSLRDGRKPLMRTSLAALNQDLAHHGFIRTHRSWIVNASAVTGLKPDGSGDFTIELGPSSVPLSRRFPEALAKLRGK